MNFNKNMNANALEWTGSSLMILDQRLLPEKTVYIEADNVESVCEAITTMKVRGAPAIGIAAAYGVALSSMYHYCNNQLDWKQNVFSDIELLAKTRPTAVNLFWALETMRKVLNDSMQNSYDDLITVANKIHRDDIQANKTIGELGAGLLRESNSILTHCNAGALATGGYGTALGVVRSAYHQGIKTIYAGETRPWLQGARLTVWELAQDQIPVTLIADSTAAWLMQSGKIDWVIVGADRIAANGDVANKIGTYSLAVLANHHKVKFMVAAPMSTIDFSCPSGSQIEIEQRDKSELLPECYQHNSFVDAWNPVFDVTPAQLITAIVTENGVVEAPDEFKLRSLGYEKQTAG